MVRKRGVADSADSPILGVNYTFEYGIGGGSCKLPILCVHFLLGKPHRGFVRVSTPGISQP